MSFPVFLCIVLLEENFELVEVDALTKFILGRDDLDQPLQFLFVLDVGQSFQHLYGDEACLAWDFFLETALNGIEEGL